MSTTADPAVDETTRPDVSTGEYTIAMKYGYGTASVAVISCLSLVGILLFPALKSRSYEHLMQFFIALGVGTMAADALIHIIPEALGLHGHSDSVHDEEAAGEDHTLYVWRMSVVYAGIYFFFVLENGIKLHRRHRKINFAEEVQHRPSSAVPMESKNETNIIENKLDIEDVISEESSYSNASTVSIGRDDRNCFGFKTIVFTVLLGDALHNVADGMAIGVSFAESATVGIGTSIAVLFHEVPHEFGDFAIYLKNGASKWQAIGLNIVAACCAFIGLYIGIAVSQNTDARLWILSAVAGTFLYISLVQVMVEMTRQLPENPLLQFLLQNLGLIIGWTMMMLLGLYEDEIEQSVS